MIETERLSLRPWLESDEEDLVEAFNNLNVSKWLSNIPYPFTHEDAKARIANIKNKTGDDHYEWAIVLKDQNKVIGAIGLRGIDYVQGIATGGGIVISHAYGGHGYGYEAWGRVLSFAFIELGLRRLSNGFFEGNATSFKMQTHFGAKVEGLARQAYVCIADGTIKDEYKTGILKEDWMKRRKELKLI